MFRLAAIAAGLGLMVAVSGCGDSCDSVQHEIEEIGHKIQKDPSSAMDHAKELQELEQKLVKMKCGMK